MIHLLVKLIRSSIKIFRIDLFAHSLNAYIRLIMSALPQGDILQFALQVYATFGENLNNTSKKIYAFRTINVIILSLTIAFILEACIEEEGIMLVKTLESAITILHVSFFFFVLL